MLFVNDAAIDFFGLPEDNGQMVAAWQKLFLSGVCVFNNMCGWFKDIFH